MHARIARAVNRRDRLLLVLTALIVAAAFLSPARRDLFVGDETKYGRILSEMRDSDSLLVPTLEGRPYSHKPPVHFWIVYLLTFPLGLNSTWAFVLPSLAMFVAMLWLVHRIAREFFAGGEMVAVFLLATFYLAWGLSQTARMDMTFIFLTSLAILHLYRFLRPQHETNAHTATGNRQPATNLLIAAALTGAAILVKGPMAFVMIAALLIIEAFRRRSWPRGNYLAAFLLAAGIPLLWLIPALLHGGAAYSRELLVEQNVGRAVNAWVHRAPPWWYLLRAPVTFFPWFFLTVTAIVSVFRYRDKGREEEKRGTTEQAPTAQLNSSSPVPLFTSSSPATEAGRFCVSWILAVLIPYSILSSKLDVYMLPALVPSALLGSWFVTRLSGSRAAGVAVILHRAVLALFALLFLAIPLIAPRFADEAPEVAMVQRPEVAGLFWTTAAVAVAALVVSWKDGAGENRLFRSVVALGVAAIYPFLYMNVFLMPLINEGSSTRVLVAALQRQPVEGSRIGLWSSPHLWTRDMPESYRNVEYLGRDRLRQPGEKPIVIATRRDRAKQLGSELTEQYNKVDELRMRGKDFDVYRRR